MADRQSEPKANQPQLPRAHDMNPREDRMDDEHDRKPEDSEVAPTPTNKPRYRS